MKDTSKAQQIARQLLDAEEDLPAPPGGAPSTPPRRQFGPGAPPVRRQFGPGAPGGGPRPMRPPGMMRGPGGPGPEAGPFTRQELSLLKDVVMMVIVIQNGVTPLEKNSIAALIKGDLPGKDELSHLVDESKRWTEASNAHKAVLGKVEMYLSGALEQPGAEPPGAPPAPPAE